MHRHAAQAQRQRDSPGADAEFESRAIAGEFGQMSTAGSTMAGSNISADDLS